MQAEFLLRRELNKNLVCAKRRSPNFYPHFHSHIEIQLVLSGQLEVFINNRRKVLKKGELWIAFSYDVHAYNTIANAEVYCLIVPTSYFGDFLSLISNKHTDSPFINDPEVYKTVRRAMERIIAGKNDISKQGYVYVILGAILDCMQFQGNSDAADTNLSPEILIYISNNFRDELTLTNLSAKFGYNSSYLSRNIHETLGISFNRYLTMLRLREAVLLLNKGEMSVTECALESGFGSTRSFYRAFQEEFGCTPKEYLNEERKKKSNF